MPTVRQQMSDLENKSVVTVFDKTNPRQKFCSFMVPSSINQAIAFKRGTDNTRSIMTYSYGDNDASQRTIVLEDPFEGVEFFHLDAKVVVSCFNQLYIGDLAFLALLLGMNHSSGAWCLLCKLLGAQFNPGPDKAPPQARTKETLKECLAKFVERCQKCKDKNLKEKPTNEKGVNCSGLLDIDPERIIVPILHCPFGSD
jgi:hypothetical protein